jgi:phosphatidylserine decarboxylase
MEAASLALGIASGLAACVGAGWAYWRYVWFFRNPERKAPAEDGVVSPADGRVVYVSRVAPGEPVISVKEGLPATVKDIARTHLEGEKLVIGVFMSPLDVHFNRAPLDATITSVHHHPPEPVNLDMGAMHRRLVFNRPPFFKDSKHILTNERVVTRMDGERKGSPLTCYVVQIAAKTVRGVESWFKPGERVGRGEIFGMIRVGSQVDLILPWSDDFSVRVKPGDRVRAGETIVVG